MVQHMSGSEPDLNMAKLEVECPICLEKLRRERQPRALPCLHTFCHDCLNDLYHYRAQPSGSRFSRTKSKKLECPVCRRRHRLPPEGTSGFQLDFRVVRMLDFVEQVQQSRLASNVDTNQTTTNKASCIESTNEKTFKDTGIETPASKTDSLSRDAMVEASAPDESDILDDVLERTLADNYQTRLVPSAPVIIPCRRRGKDSFASTPPEVKISKPSSSDESDPRRDANTRTLPKERNRSSVSSTTEFITSSEDSSNSFEFRRNSRRGNNDFFVNVLSAFFNVNR